MIFKTVEEIFAYDYNVCEYLDCNQKSTHSYEDNGRDRELCLYHYHQISHMLNRW